MSMVYTLLPSLPQGDPTGGYTHCYLPYLRGTQQVGLGQGSWTMSMVYTLLPSLPQGDPTGGYTHCYLPYLRGTPQVGLGQGSWTMSMVHTLLPSLPQGDPAVGTGSHLRFREVHRKRLTIETTRVESEPTSVEVILS